MRTYQVGQMTSVDVLRQRNKVIMVEQEGEREQKTAEGTSKTKVVFYTFATNTSCHGFNCIAQCKSVIGKILWTMLLVAATSLLLYQSSAVIMEYLKHSRVTEINLRVSTSAYVCFLTYIYQSLLAGYTSNNDTKHICPSEPVTESIR